MADSRVLKIITPAKTYDLVSLQQVKAEIGITKTTSDEWLEDAISQMSSVVAGYCRRVFPIEVVQETILRGWGTGVRAGNPQSVRLRRYPVVLIQSLLENGNALVENEDFVVDQASGILTRLHCSGLPGTWHASSLAITYAGGYAQLYTKTGAVPSPPQITVDNSNTFELDCGVVDAAATVFAPVAASPSQGQYTVSNAGVYGFSTIDEGNVVTVKSASTSIPGDIQRGMLRLMTMAYYAKGRDPMQVSTSDPDEGDQRFWVGGLPNQEGPFPPEIAMIFDRYKAPRFG